MTGDDHSGSSGGLRLDPATTNPWSLRSPGVVFEDHAYRVRRDDVVQPDGAPGAYTYVELRHPVVAILPLNEDDEVYLVRQWRYPWKRSSWEIPAGHVEAGESPLVAAMRELAEEVGLQAASWTPFGSTFPSALVSAEAHLFVARDLSPSPNAQRDGAEQDMIVQRVPFQEAVDAALRGDIVHGISLVALLKAAHVYGPGGPRQPDDSR